MLRPQTERVILRSFVPNDPTRISTIIGRALALTESDAEAKLAEIQAEFNSRHRHFDQRMMAQYNHVLPHLFTQRPLSKNRQLLVGAMFLGEYSIESAALFNPSIVAHPDQQGVAPGELRIILSLRATGEGHISSIEFRSGMLSASGDLTLDNTSRFAELPSVLPNPSYKKKIFTTKLYEMGFENTHTATVMEPLVEEFTRTDLHQTVNRLRQETLPSTQDFKRTIDFIQWLADSNYELEFTPDIPLSERVIFPTSANESNGIEDARFVQFIDDDGSVMYYATYTAYNGRTILPQLIETRDFLHFRVLTLNGTAVHNKGMALFPRKINGKYAMLSRKDDENLFIMTSTNAHNWNDPQLIMRPAEPWEFIKIGNCGSPIETPDGWIVVTHGVGPMRKYCIGVALLDLNDPQRVIARLPYPILMAEGADREGYVPNVVYSCGGMIHADTVILPYALSDHATTVAQIPVPELLTALRENRC